MDLYHAHQLSDSVIDNYMLSNSHLSLEEIEFEVEREKALRLAEANKLYKELSLPPWKKLPLELKQAYRTAACGSEINGAALTCNLGWTVAGKALANPEAAARMIGRKVRAVLAKLGLPLSLAITLEFSGKRTQNPTLHIHGAFSVPEKLKAVVWKELRKALAHDYIIRANKPVWTVPIYEPGGWEAYTLKNLKKTLTRIDRPFYATHEASRLGEKLYNDIRRWLKAEARFFSENEFKKLVSACEAPRTDKLLALIEEHKNRRKERRAASRRRTIAMKKQAKSDPAAFYKQLAETLLGAGAEWPTWSDTVIERNHTSDMHLHSLAGSSLKDRYGGDPNVGMWETVGLETEADSEH